MSQTKLSAIFLFCSFVLGVYSVLITYHSRWQYRGFEPFVQVEYPLYDSVSAEIERSDLVILCLGGSTTNDLRLSHNDKYPAVLESLLSDRYPGCAIKVLNAGMDWYTSKHSLINYITYYKKFEPDIVIVMHAINDICRSFEPVEFSIGTYQDSYSHYYGPAINAAKPFRVEDFYFKKLLGEGQYHSFKYNLQPSDYEQSQFRSLDAYGWYMKELLLTIKDDGSLPVFVEQPSIFKENNTEIIESMLWFGFFLCNNGKTYPDGASMFRAMKAFNSKVQATCKLEQVHFVKTKSAIPSDTCLFKDDVHQTPLGARKLAEEVFNSLLLRLDDTLLEQWA